jgi:transketolase
MSIEELGLACSLAGFVVIAPADEPSTKALVRAAASHFGPVFIRAGRVKAPLVYNNDHQFEIGKAIQVADGKDVTIIANGLLVAQSLLAADALDAEGISARVIDMHTAKPIDRDAIARAAEETGAIVVAEEHLIDTGLGVRVAQVVGETHPCPMEFVGIHDTYAESGQQAELMEKYGLVAANVAAAARKVVARKR